MENYFVYPLGQVDDFMVSTAATFDACGIWRKDAAAEQHKQRLASRNAFVRQSIVPSVLQISEIGVK